MTSEFCVDMQKSESADDSGQTGNTIRKKIVRIKNIIQSLLLLDFLH